MSNVANATKAEYIPWTANNYRLLCEQYGTKWTEEADQRWRQACIEDATRDAAYQDDMRRG